jgi:pimeloyl-ACP methyl ester carboxylesterase
MMLSMKLFLIGILGLSFLSVSIFNQQDHALAQQYIQTIKYRSLVIDLGNGVKTNAQLTLPAIGKGPFPSVLLVHGSGRTDMNETGPNAKPFWQISQYLSERGFAVLRYDKRGIGANHTIVDSNIWGNATFNDLKRDAQRALAVLINQPEVDPNEITILGHSEGTILAPRVAIDNATKVKNIVLMGAVAQNSSDIAYLQGVSLPLLYAEKVLDHDHSGMLSISEANQNPVFSTLAGNLTLLLETTNGTKHQLNPKYNTNNDAYISINNELKPKLIAQLKSLSVVTPGKKCTGTCPIWFRSHYALEPTLNIIGNVPPKTSILILQGENDTQTPVHQAFLLQQALIDKRHPDHTLITYPNLGHLFYPSSEWQTGFGPIQQNVLADLYSWLEAHSGFTRTPTVMPSFYSSSSSSSSTNSTTKNLSEKSSYSMSNPGTSKM